jgi:hypothetical protein
MTQETNGDLVLALNFVPAWARQPADKNPYAGFEGRAGSRRERASRPAPDRNRSALGTRQAFADRRRSDRGGRPEHGRPRTRAPGEPARPDFSRRRPEPLLEVAFIPEQRGLQPLARLFAKTAQAYALMEVASMFLSRPEFHAVKLEVLAAANPPDSPASLYQCRECLAVFTGREPALLHGFARHFDLFYTREETPVEPPKGNFICVARCGLSGALLGPPNYHEFNDRLLELHRTRFASMPLEEYRSKIVNDADPAALAQWKQEVCKAVVYRTRREGAPAQVFKRRAEVEAHFREQIGPGLIRAGRRFIVPGPASRQMDDPAVCQAIRQAWIKENRFPLKMAGALHPAFRRYGLTTFKTPDKTTFVTAIAPHPIDPAQVMEVIRRLLEHLMAHPGTSRSELVTALFPGAAPNAPAIADVINQLRWLIDKGHVIEFSNGKLAVPFCAAAGPAAAPGARNEAKTKPPPGAPAKQE